MGAIDADYFNSTKKFRLEWQPGVIYIENHEALPKYNLAEFFLFFQIV
jgi:hypothetical protein